MTLELIDSHCHIDGDGFDADRDAVLDRARAAGVVASVVVGGTSRTIEDLDRPIRACGDTADLFPTVGVHPHDAEVLTGEMFAAIERLCRLPRVVAVGESGLDYHYDHSPRDAQRAGFAEHIRIAHRVGKPVICHVRDAHDDARRILADEGAAAVGAVIHCFTGTPDDAAAYAAMGLFVSFSGIATFPSRSSEPIRQAIRQVPLDRLLIETDAPFLAPTPMRGKRNEPAFLVHTAEVVAREAGLPVAELAARTAANARTLFALTADRGGGYTLPLATRSV
jgi:TatD DNase family protein